MNFEAIAQLLVDAGVGQVGKTLFANFMPADRTGVLLRNSFTGMTIDHEVPGWRNGAFMLVVRNKDYAAGEALIKKAMAALTMDETELGDMRVNYIRPRHDPLVYQPSPGQMIEFLVNIDCSYLLL